MSSLEARIDRSGVYDSELGEIFNFTAGDLDANRRNQMSENQKNRLQTNMKMSVGVLGFIIIAMLIIIGLTLTSENAQVEVILFIGGGAILLCAYGIYYQYSRYKRDIADGGVASIKGAVEVTSEVKSRPRASQANTAKRATGAQKQVYHYIKIEDKSFKIPGRAYDVLMNGKTYTLYYTPHSNQLLAIE